MIICNQTSESMRIRLPFTVSFVLLVVLTSVNWLGELEPKTSSSTSQTNAICSFPAQWLTLHLQKTQVIACRTVYIDQTTHA